MALVDGLTLEETFSLTRHRVLRALLSVLLTEINRRRANEAALMADLLREINVLRIVAQLEPISLANLTAKTPPQVTLSQMLTIIKESIT